MRKIFLRNMLLLSLLMLLVMSVVRCDNKPVIMPAQSSETKLHWQTGLVAAILLRGGESFYTYFSPPPEAIVYSDGRKIVWYHGYLYEEFLSTQEMCELFTEIDNSGFFRYTVTDYQKFYKAAGMKPGPENFLVKVDAWKENSLQLQSFPFLFSQYRDVVEWPISLTVPYERLRELDFNQMSRYEAANVAVHIEEDPNLGTEIEIEKWNSVQLSLSELIELYNRAATPASNTSVGEIVLSGDDGKQVLVQFEGKPWGEPKIFVVDGERYLVAIRALLPYEESGGIGLPIIPSPGINNMSVSLSCSS